MKHLLALLLFFQFSALCAQQNPYGLAIISTKQEYLKSVAKDPNKALVDIKRAVPGVMLDIRYATKNNFMKQVMYPSAHAFARRPVVEQLKKIQAQLKKKGYGLVIYEGIAPTPLQWPFTRKRQTRTSLHIRKVAPGTIAVARSTCRSLT